MELALLRTEGQIVEGGFLALHCHILAHVWLKCYVLFFVCFVFLRQGLIQLRLASNSLRILNWDFRHVSPQFMCSWGPDSEVLSMQVFYQISHIPNCMSQSFYMSAPQLTLILKPELHFRAACHFSVFCCLPVWLVPVVWQLLGKFDTPPSGFSCPGLCLLAAKRQWGIGFVDSKNIPKC